MMDNELTLMQPCLHCYGAKQAEATALWLAELGIFDRGYATKTAGSTDEHLYPDPGGFTPTRIRADSLSIRRWVVIPASPK
jgi:hypothetical protein